jgi:hypothetical protein
VQPEEWAQREAQLLERLLARVKADPQFDDAEAEALRVLIKAYRGWSALGWFAKWFIYLLAATAGAITAWRTITEGVRQWFTGA